MVRAIGTMGVVAGLVGAITFAQLTSNTVALDTNNVTVATATLAIGVDCNPINETTGIQGFSVPALAPGSSSSITFCLTNTGTVPLSITAAVPETLGSTAAADTTMTIDCGLGAPQSGTLDDWGSGTFSTQLNAGAQASCTGTVALSGSYTGPGGASVGTFTVNFTGTQVE